MTDAAGRISEDSPTWRAFTGQTIEDWRANRWIDVVHPDDRDRAIRVWQLAVSQGRRYETQYRLWHASLGWRWTRARGMPILGALGQIEGWLGLNDDITEQVAERDKLRESQEQFRVLADLIPSLIWVADGAAQVYFWNRAWYTYTGASEAESLGLEAANFIREDLRAKALDQWGRAVEGSIPFEMEVPLRASNGDFRWFLAKAHPITDEAGAVLRWVGSMVDIHAQRQQIDGLEQQRRAREQYVVTLSHDLRNALGAGQTSFDLLRTEHDQTHRIQFETIVENSFRRTERMVRDLLDANSLEHGQAFPLKTKTRLNLSELITSACSSHQVGDAVVKIAHCDEQVVFWDANAITRVLDNLIDNARKYRAGGDVRVWARTAGLNVELAVQNLGHGISEADKQDLFRLFARAETDVKSGKTGWGIGLTLVKGIVEAHGGQVDVTSDAERGTIFTCRIPIEHAGADAGARAVFNAGGERPQVSSIH